ncbi:nucleotide exchange factor GrpE [Hydrogenoanaerobacterium sp.]|uniref:nucleotide exchange factor GrpE n=1 Tax=Hydrogenoanaerobacterium sp. TaxID=2953763 RepID=UPI002899C9A7|nr:nucleotide exchange factor GrpE [Hydrogenoanaerobacterium sp.]
MSAKKAKESAPQAEEAKVEDVATEETAAQPAVEQEISEADLLKKQMEELNDKLMRTLAEYDNYRKRSQKERLEIYPEAVAQTVSKFLPVLDNFDRAMESECEDSEFKKGVDMIFTSFKECLKALNVEEIEAEGKEFDPNLHNAVMHLEDENLGENTIAAVFQKGYKMGDKVLRHAMVQVAN